MGSGVGGVVVVVGVRVSCLRLTTEVLLAFQAAAVGKCDAQIGSSNGSLWDYFTGRICFDGGGCVCSGIEGQ